MKNKILTGLLSGGILGIFVACSGGGSNNTDPPTPATGLVGSYGGHSLGSGAFFDIDDSDFSLTRKSGFGLLGFSLLSDMAYNPARNVYYVVDVLSNYLVAVNATTLDITPIGHLGYGPVNETIVNGGLAFDPGTNTLYGVDMDTDQLISIDIDTGRGAMIGEMVSPAPDGNFAVSGLAFNPNTHTLYGLEYQTDVLLSIDTSTGASTPIGAIGGGHVSTYVLTYDTDNNRLLTTDQGTGELLELDASTGVASSIITLTNTSNAGLSGLAYNSVGHQLKGVDLREELISIDTGTGSSALLTRFGASSIEGLAFDATTNSYYGADTETDTLYRIDAGNGQITFIGRFTGHPGGMTGLTYNPNAGVLYGVGDGNALVSINPATAAVTPVDLLSGGLYTGLAYDAVNGILYGIQANGAINTLDPVTASATSSVAPAGFNAGGLAYNPASNELYTFNTDTNEAVKVDAGTGNTTILGLVGYDDIAAMTYNSGTGTLYGTDSQHGHLVRINTTTGAGTTVDATGISRGNAMAYDRNTDTVYSAGNHYLTKINKTTGEDTVVGYIGTFDVTALAYDPNNDLLYGINFNTGELLTIDTADASPTVIGPVVYISPQSIYALAYDSNNDMLYGGTHGQLLTISTIDASASFAVAVSGLVTSMAYDAATSRLIVSRIGTERIVAYEPDNLFNETVLGTTDILFQGMAFID